MSENDFFCLLVTFFFRAPPVCLLPNSHYEQVMTAFGGKGYFVQTPEELQESLKKSLMDTTKPSLINIMIEPQSMRKAQVNVIAKQKAEMHLPSHPQKYLTDRHCVIQRVLSKTISGFGTFVYFFNEYLLRYMLGILCQILRIVW